MARYYNSFLGRWVSPDEQSVQELAALVIAFVEAGREHTPELFDHWYLQGMTKGEAATVFEFTPENVAAQLEKGKNNQFPDLGFSFAVWNGKEDDHKGSLTFRIGNYSNESFNVVELNFNSPGPTFQEGNEGVDRLDRVFDSLPDHAEIVFEGKELSPPPV